MQMDPSAKDEIEGNLPDVKCEVGQEIGQADSKHEEIALLAYQNWQRRGRPIGTPEEDWFSAEDEIKQHLNEASTATSIDTKS
jgi:hypothetical protein